MDGYYRRSPVIASRFVDGEAVLVKMSDCVLYVLNSSASRVWLMADGVRSPAEIAEGNDPAAVAAFLRRLVEIDLMERSTSALPEPDVFPQTVELPPSPEPPAILVSERVEVLAAPSTCTLADFGCSTIQ